MVSFVINYATVQRREVYFTYIVREINYIDICCYLTNFKKCGNFEHTVR